MTKPRIVACSHIGCGKRFPSVSSLNMHIAAMHKKAPPEPAKKESWLAKVFKKIFRRA